MCVFREWPTRSIGTANELGKSLLTYISITILKCPSTPVMWFPFGSGSSREGIKHHTSTYLHLVNLFCQWARCIAEAIPLSFRLGTEMPRHSAGGVGSSIHAYICGMYCSQCECASNGSRELHHSYYMPAQMYLYHWDHAQKWSWFSYKYTYQDRDYIIRTMNTKPAQCTCYIQLVTKPYTLSFLLQPAHKLALSHSKNICDQVA